MVSNSLISSHRELTFTVLFSGSTDTHPIQKAASTFAEAVERRTNGEISVKVHSVNTLYTQMETLSKTTRGIIDMSLATQGALDKYVKAFAVVMLPFAYDDYDHAYRVLDGPFKDWVAPLLEKEKLVFIALVKLKENGMIITTPDIGQFRAMMDPAYKRVVEYVGEDNVKKFMEMIKAVRR